MSDLEKLFEHAPEGATEIAVNKHDHEIIWVKKDDKGVTGWSLDEWDTWDVNEEFETIATRPQPEQPRKTVEDAVEAIPHADPSILWTHVRVGRAKGDFFLADGSPSSPYWDASDFVCTREQFEACVAAKAMRETRKTPEDAVEGKWVVAFGMDTLSDKRCLVGYNHEEGVFFTCESDYGFTDSEESLVCTREELYACVAAKAKSEPEWTHEYGYRKCRVIYTDGDLSWIVIEGTGQKLVPTVSVHPIKPTITKAEAEERLGVTITD